MPQNILNDYSLDEIIENLVTEDDEPVDNIISAKQMRLLVEPLYSSWKPTLPDDPAQPRKFFADCDVGIFTTPYQPPVAPDMFLSLDVEANPNFYEKKNRSYFFWEFGKMPEVVVEIVSNKKGDEAVGKMKTYAKMAISYYVVFDPLKELSEQVVRVYELGFAGRRYQLRKDLNLPEVGLSLTLWQGEFEATEFEWLRWCDAQGNLIPTGKERAEKLEAKLRELGIDPTQI
jgi:Uma2 family endonuclease